MAIFTHHLVLLIDLEQSDVLDFYRIADEIQKREPGIAVFVMSQRQYRKAKLKRWRIACRPTLVVGLLPVEPRCYPTRGTVMGGSFDCKIKQYQRLDACGEDSIPWRAYDKAHTFDKAEWGARVLVKPAVSYRGEGVFTCAIEDLSAHVPEEGEWLVQRLIDTGEHPVCHRVLTCFGEPILHIRSENPTRSTQKSSAPVVNGEGCSRVCFRDAEIESYAKHVATVVYPGVPTLGIDIIREASTQKMYVCEFNPYGMTWHFSSPRGKTWQAESGENCEVQFGMVDRCAETFIQATFKHAT